MREENPLVMILIELCHMTSTWNMSCDQSQVDIYCIEPTLNFYINLKMALFLFIQGRIQRSICMHKMDYIFDITGRNVEKSDSQVILFFLHIFVTSLWSHFHYFSFWYACPITSWKLSYYKVSCKFIQMEFTIDEIHSNYFKIPTIRG